MILLLEVNLILNYHFVSNSNHMWAYYTAENNNNKLHYSFNIK